MFNLWILISVINLEDTNASWGGQNSQVVSIATKKNISIMT